MNLLSISINIFVIIKKRLCVIILFFCPKHGVLCNGTLILQFWGGESNSTYFRLFNINSDSLLKVKLIDNVNRTNCESYSKSELYHYHNYTLTENFNFYLVRLWLSEACHTCYCMYKCRDTHT